MKTKQGIEYSIEGGRFTIDGYDFFDTLEALEADLDWQNEWARGRAMKDGNGWHRI